ncbi:hypothetical protein NFJ02_32g82060 [Pycnococcus provasolii]
MASKSATTLASSPPKPSTVAPTSVWSLLGEQGFETSAFSSFFEPSVAEGKESIELPKGCGAHLLYGVAPHELSTAVQAYSELLSLKLAYHQPEEEEPVQDQKAFGVIKKHVVRRLKTDNDSAIIKGEFAKLLSKNNILYDGQRQGPSPPYTPKAGGKHERIIDTLWSHVVAAIKPSGIPFKYWPIVLKHITVVYNNLIHDSTSEIPTQVWLGSTQDLTAMRTIGCTIYIWTPKELRTAADSRAKAFTYLGWKNASTCFTAATTAKQPALKKLDPGSK